MGRPEMGEGKGPHLVALILLTFPNANYDMNTIATFTHRQQPVADRFNDILDMAASTAAAIADNAWDEATPIDPDAARHWIRRLDEVRTSLVNAQAAARGE